MKIKNIKVGMKFSTENKLKIALGLNPAKGNQGKSQIKEIMRFLDYEKTHKVSRGKETNEIIITEIYSKPLPKIDKRTERSSEYIDALSPALQFLENGRYTTAMLMQAVGLIDDKDIIDTYYEYNSSLKSYKNFFKSEFKRKAISAMNHLAKTTSFEWEYCYFMQEYEEQKFYKFHKADKKETALIQTIISKNQKLMEQKYNKEFKRLKFDTERFAEYIDNVNDDIFNETGYIRCIMAFQIKSCSDKNVFDYETQIDDLMDCTAEKKYSDDIKEIFESRMKHIIETYRYDLNRYIRNSIISNNGFGDRLPMLHQDENFVYPLQVQEVYSLHESIFNKQINLENTDSDREYPVALDDTENLLDFEENPF
jgi:hypothetical protein